MYYVNYEADKAIMFTLTFWAAMPKPTGVATSTALRQLMLHVQQLLTFIDRTNLFGRDNTQL